MNSGDRADTLSSSVGAWLTVRPWSASCFFYKCSILSTLKRVVDRNITISWKCEQLKQHSHDWKINRRFAVEMALLGVCHWKGEENWTFLKNFTLNNLFQHQKHEGKHKQCALANWGSWTGWFNVIVVGFAAGGSLRRLPQWAVKS